MRRFHLLSGEMPPSIGGIAQFTTALAKGLAARGCEVHVWAPGAEGSASGTALAIHSLPDHFGKASRRVLEGTVQNGDVLLLQYAPNALGARGSNVGFCNWLCAMSRKGHDVRVMFHEPYFYFGWQSIARNALAAVQRVMAILLLRAARVAYVPTPAWAPLLRVYARRDLQFAWVPVPSPVPVTDDAVAVQQWRRRLDAPLIVGHYSSYPADVRAPLRNALRDILEQHPQCAVLCIGANSDTFVEELGRDVRVHATGQLDGPAVSAAIQACDLFVQPYPDGVTTRRTSLMTLLSHGACVVGTTGSYTEALWSGAGVIAAAPAGNRVALSAETERLARSPAARREQGQRARTFYRDRFGPDHAATAVLHKGVPPLPVVLGAHAYSPKPARAASRHAVFARRLVRNASVDLVNVQFVDGGDDQRVDGAQTLNVLRDDSIRRSGRQGPRKPIVSEIMDALAYRAMSLHVRYFLYVNADVEVSPEIFPLIEHEGRDAYVFARTDTERGESQRILRSGVDAFAFDARWWMTNRFRFRPYVLGEPTWDNVYAAVALAHSDGVFVASPGLLSHERHDYAWHGSPFADYQHLLASLDAPYFTRWCEYHERVKGVAEPELPDVAERAAAETFHTQETRAGRLRQSARAARARIRHALLPTGAA